MTDHPSAQYDIMATLADLINVDAPDHDGVSLLPTLLDQKDQQKQHDFLYFEYPEKGGQLAIRMGKWKGIKTGLKEEPEVLWEIYNLEEDPFETTDVVKEHPELVEKLDEIVESEHLQATIREWEIIHINETY